jgi:D-lactate dehydrogenase
LRKTLREYGMADKVAFFEVEDWQVAYLRERLPGIETSFLPDPFTVDSARDCTGISTFIYSRLEEADLRQLPELRWIATRSTGFDHIAAAACEARGIPVSNVPHYGENTIAEHTFALILALSRKVHQAVLRTQHHNFSVQGLRGFDLKGRTLGVVGAGNIGLHVIRIGRGFGMRVLAYDTRPNILIGEVLGFEYTSLDELVEQSDILSLNVPLVPATRHLMNRERLSRMKPGSILVNTARGEVVDTEALLWALDEGILAGAGLDVLEGEGVLREEHPIADASQDQLRLAVHNFHLLARENVVITPHLAFYSQEAEQRILDTTLENIRGFVAGQPVNAVSA